MSHSEPRRADSEKGNETDSAKNEKWKDISGEVKKLQLFIRFHKKRKYEVNFPT